MKKFLLLFGCVLTVVACQSPIFESVPQEAKMQPVYPLQLIGSEQEVYLTDYYPQWVGADSVTVKGELTVAPLTEDWSRFKVTSEEGCYVTTLTVWKEGKPASIVAMKGERNPENYLFTAGSMMKVITISTQKQPQKVVAMWQNNRLPDDYIIPVEGAFGVMIPKDAADVERSFIRVFASDENGLYNDVLVPLASGKVITDVKSLNRHDNQAQVLYSLMIDRFYNGNTENDKPLNRPDVLSKVDYQGGDLKGITKKIEEGFFTDLGITTIWISPITQNPYDAWGQNVDPDTKFSGYHGYWPIYTTRIDERFGSDAELRELLDVAHKSGMNVILDYVANHLHINSPVLQEHPDWTTPLMLPDGRRNLELWDEQRLTTWFDVHIPTLDLERDEVCDPMTDSALYWVANYDFDGFRHDACKHIPENYWRMLCHKMKSRFPERKLWQIGETYGSPQLIGSYVKSGMIDAQFDFNIYHTTRDVLLDDRQMKDIADEVSRSAAAYGSHHTMGNITGNHDKPRFISLAGGALSPFENDKYAGWHRTVGVGDPVGYKKLALMNAIITTIPGVPCIYQGDEYGIPGANDPDNRYMMVFDGYTEVEQQQKEMTKELIKLRRTELPLIYGDMTTLHLEGNLWVFARAYMNEYVVVAINNGAESVTAKCELPAGYALKALENNFDSNCAVDVVSSSIDVELAPYSFEVMTCKKSEN
ncbi:MAG: alpha-amylase family glycosyl hydrolase [Alistipes sp.]|nr:alpha-amylase family glycosyl hydrolase [Alistipes sp.]